jgi:YhcH/YjgK/YiaL family protein
VILDAVSEAARYRGTHPAIDRALDLLATVPWLELEEGRHELAEGVFALLSSYVTEEPGRSRFEGHRRHADVQLLLQGQETIYWAPAADLQPDGEYDAAGDILHFREPLPEKSSAALAVRPGLFLLLYPSDAHKPGRVLGAPQAVRKAVLKVRL